MDIKKVGQKKSIKEKLESLKKKPSSHAPAAGKSQFHNKLMEVTHTREVHMELDQLLEKINEAGERFARTQDIVSLQEYKSLIKSFLDTMMGKLFKIKEKTSSRSFIKQKVYITVEKINKELEDLTKLVLEKQNSNINLLAKLDEIRGMLIDLYK